jgi:hypothetical protein
MKYRNTTKNQIQVAAPAVQTMADPRKVRHPALLRGEPFRHPVIIPGEKEGIRRTGESGPPPEQKPHTARRQFIANTI